MASKKAIPVAIDSTGMPPADPLDGTEYVHIVQGEGHNSRVTTLQAIANLALAAGAAILRYAATVGALAANPVTIMPCYLGVAGREGWFIFDGSNLAAKVAADGFNGIYIAPTGEDGSTGAWVRRYSGAVMVSWFGVADGAATNAARVESIEALFYPRAAHICDTGGEVSFDRGIVFARPHRVELSGYGTQDWPTPNGNGPSVWVFPHGTTAIRFKHGPGGFLAGSSGAQRGSFSHGRIEFEGAIPAGGTGDYAGGSALQITNVTPIGNYANGNVVLLEGAGPRLTVPGRTVAMPLGGNIATVTNALIDGTNRFIANPGVYVGQPITITGAGAAGADLSGFVGTWGTDTIDIVDAAGAALNAATAVVAATYSLKFPLIAEVAAGGGTGTLTINAFPNSNFAVVGAKLRRVSVGVYTTTTINTQNIEVNPQGSAGALDEGGGIGILHTGITSDQSNADGCLHINPKIGGSETFAGIVFQGSDAQAGCLLNPDCAGPKVGILDMSELGNDIDSPHLAFNVGVVATEISAFTKLKGGYLETYTSWLAPENGSATYSNTLGMSPKSGFKGLGIFANDLWASGLNLTGPITTQNDDALGFGGKIDGGFWGLGIRPAYFTGNMNGVPGGVGTNSGIALGNSNGGAGGYNVLFSADNLGAGTLRELSISASAIRFGSSYLGTQFGTLTAVAFDHPAAFRVNGSQVVGARGASLPADATDLASALALVNAIKARMKTTGGHGLVAD